MKENVLVIIKPDGLNRDLVGHILSRFGQAHLELVALKMLQATKALAESHYLHIKGQPFYQDVIEYLLGKHHKQKNIIVIIYRGINAIKKCRKICGATNPEEANLRSIRGSYGRITTKGIYENLLHVSSSQKDAEREIKLWFGPGEIPIRLYKTKNVRIKSFIKPQWT